MLAAKMVDRMVKNRSKSGGKYISVHLRFEEVLCSLSFSGMKQNSSSYVYAVWCCEHNLTCFTDYRIWLHFHVVYMMVARKKRERWILRVKEAGEENFVEGGE